MKDLHNDPRFAPLDLSRPAPQLEPYRAPPTPDDDKRNFEIAIKMWRDSVPIAGTLAERYLRNRAITLDPLPEVLRFHPSCYHGPTKTRLPAMVALYTNAVTGKPQGAHRTFLKPDGSGKADVESPRLTLGNSLHAVVRLIEDAEVTDGLGIAEGIETALSLLSLGWQPVWAALSSGNIANFPILGGCNLTIFADNDLPDAKGKCVGLEAALACSKRWTAAGREVEVTMPRRQGQQKKIDWNDVLIGLTNGAAK